MEAPCVRTITHGAIRFYVHCASIRMFFTCLSCSLHGDIGRGFCGRAFYSFWFRFCFPHFRSGRRSCRVRQRDVIIVFAYCAVYKTSTMPSTSFICRHHAFIHHASRAHSFDFFCFRFSIITMCTCCCCVLLFLLALSHLHFIACAAAFFWRRLFDRAIAYSASYWRMRSTCGWRQRYDTVDAQSLRAGGCVLIGCYQVDLSEQDKRCSCLVFRRELISPSSLPHLTGVQSVQDRWSLGCSK